MKKSVVFLFAALLVCGNSFAKDDVLEQSIKNAVQQVDKALNQSVQQVVRNVSDSLTITANALDSVSAAIDTIAVAVDDRSYVPNVPDLHVDLDDVSDVTTIVAIGCFCLFGLPLLFIILVIYLIFRHRRKKDEMRLEEMRIMASNDQDMSKYIKEIKQYDPDHEQQEQGIKQMCLGIGLGILLYIVMKWLGAAIGILIFCIGAGKYLIGRRRKNAPTEHREDNNINS